MSFKGITSTLNSTSTPLGSSGVFTGSFEDVSEFSFISFMVFSNLISATDGLEFHWSSDGTNADRVETSSVLAGSGRAFALGIRGKYFRVKYTNTNSSQTTFRLQTIFHFYGTGLITKPLKGSVSGDNFAQLVQAPAMARLLDDSYANIAGIKLDSTALFGIADATAIMANEGFAFKISTNRVSTGSTNEVAYLLISNPTASGKVIRLDKIVFLPPEANTTADVTFRVYMNPTVTANGTLLTPVGNRQNNQVTGVGLFYSLPTVSANGNFNFMVSMAQSSPPFVYDLESGTLIESGFKMLITADQTASGSGGGINIEYNEAIQ